MRKSVTAILAAVLLAAGPAHAEEKLSKIIPKFFTEEGFLLAAAGGHEAHFLNFEAGAPFVAFNAAISAQFATPPIGAPSGGFTFVFDPSVGADRRTSESFGSPFAERALTIGKHKWSVGFAYLRQSFDSFDGIDLQDGSVQAPLLHQNEPPLDQPTTDPYYEGDLIFVRSDVEMTLDTALFFANYGVSDRIDLGVVLPLVRADLNFRGDADLRPYATLADGFTLHVFANGPQCVAGVTPTGNPECFAQSVSRSGSASGVGDLVLRGKYRFFEREDGAIAAAADVRVPTGDEEDFLGSGATQVRLYAIGSAQFGRFSPHANLGYTFSSGGPEGVDIPDEAGYTVGFDVALHPRVTLAADFVGRTLFDSPRARPAVYTHTYVDPAAPGGLVNVDIPTTEAYTDDVTLLRGALGFRFNVAKNTLLNVGGIFSLSKNDGLNDDFAAAFGLDYSF